MTRQEFFESLETDPLTMPAAISQPLQALWLLRAKRWDDAHALARDISNPEGAWVQAHLHRVKGDMENAALWYAQANQPLPAAIVPLDSEFQNLLAHFLA